MDCNKECYWNFDTQCVSEDEKTYGHITQYTDECVGYLDKNFEHDLWDTYSECIGLLSKRKLEELNEIRTFILNQRRDKCRVQ